MNPDVIMAMTLPLSFLLFVAGFLYYRYKFQEKRLDSLIKIVELGGNVDPDMMKMLSAIDRKTYKTDFRSGLIWLSIGIPLSISLYMLEGLSSALIGSIFIFIGIANLISGKYRWREED